VPNISITDFTDFILRTGQPRITKVSEIIKRGEYHPSRDFWKLLRDQICDFHAGTATGISFGLTGAAEKKQERYEEVIKGYKKFLTTTKPIWFKSHRAQWEFEDLIIRINPEVGFEIGGESLLVKLYFKQEPLTKSRVQVVLGIMSAAQKNKKYKVGILDTVRSKLYQQTTHTPQMDALLKGEAATFLAIWKSLVQ
jgi:hypothetical protein